MKDTKNDMNKKRK